MVGHSSGGPLVDGAAYDVGPSGGKEKGNFLRAALAIFCIQDGLLRPEEGLTNEGRAAKKAMRETRDGDRRHDVLHLQGVVIHCESGCCRDAAESVCRRRKM